MTATASNPEARDTGAAVWSRLVQAGGFVTAGSYPEPVAWRARAARCAAPRLPRSREPATGTRRGEHPEEVAPVCVTSSMRRQWRRVISAVAHGVLHAQADVYRLRPPPVDPGARVTVGRRSWPPPPRCAARSASCTGQSRPGRSARQRVEHGVAMVWPLPRRPGGRPRKLAPHSISSPERLCRAPGRLP